MPFTRLGETQSPYPFGMQMPGRKYQSVTLSSAEGYRYGFNGKEKDKYINSQACDYGMRISDLRIGRFLSIDPIATQYPELTPYQYASNRPIDGIDIDGLEWFYSNNVFNPGWQMSTKLQPPPIMYTESMKQKYYNDRGYLTLDQKNAIEKEIKAKQDYERAVQNAEAFNDGIKALNRSRNIIAQAYDISPFSLIVPCYEAASNENYQELAIIAVVGTTDISPLFRTFGKVYAKVATEIAGKFTMTQVWGIENNLARGLLVEAKLAAKYVSEGFEWMAKAASPFFPTFDFFNEAKKTAVSLKSVNASKSFTFQNILDNISKLKELKGSTINKYGYECQIEKVQLDIAIPKGYDKSRLADVEKNC